MTLITQKEITRCTDCPFFSFSVTANYDYCKFKFPSRTITEPFSKIDPGCPLKNIKEYKGSKPDIGDFIIRS